MRRGHVAMPASRTLAGIASLFWSPGWPKICSHFLSCTLGKCALAPRSGCGVSIMTSDIYTPVESAANGARVDPSITATVKGILDDALDLAKQQLALVKAEIRDDIRNVVAAILPIVYAVAPLLLGGLMLCFALVHALHWISTPAGLSLDPAALPLWACYAIVAAFFLVVGGTLLGIGVYRLKTLRPLAEQSTKAFEENIQW